MARHINKRHQEFIKHIQQRIASRYNHNTSSNTPTFDTDQKTPIVPEVVRHRIYTRLNKNKPADIPTSTPTIEPALDAFEKEYQEFIAKLKAQKEQKLKEIEQVDIVEEQAPKKKRTRKKKTDNSTEETKTKKRRTRKTKEKVEE